VCVCVNEDDRLLRQNGSIIVAMAL
jgi:hypothetical protein